MEDLSYRLVSFCGLIVMLFIAWLFSENRRAISRRVVLWGLGLQLALALLFLRSAVGEGIFRVVENVFGRLLQFSDAGSSALFGSLTTDQSLGATLAFKAMPIIIFVASLAAVLYHLGVVQTVVKGMAWLMQRTMGTSGAESLSAALLVFLGIESTTAIEDYIQRMTRSELFVVMTAFLATIASSVMGIYVDMGASAGHLLAASLMSAPAAIVIAKIMIPETDTPLTAGIVEFRPKVQTANVMDAAASGAIEGVKLAINVVAMLIAFLALVAAVNFVLEGSSAWVMREVLGMESAEGFTLEGILGWCFSGIAAAMGVPRGEWTEVGRLLGIKTVFNEFLAYKEMAGMAGLSERARAISTYALCGFANFGSIAILIGGLSVVAPERRSEVAGLGLRALVAGSLAAFMTACYAGMFL
jgi:CNT family concentrative nucleoside transporter